MGQHVRRPGVLAGGEHGADPLDGISREALAGPEHCHELGDHLDREFDGRMAAGESDLVTADVHVCLELALEDAQELIPRTEDVHHVDRCRNRDSPHLLQADVVGARAVQRTGGGGIGGTRRDI